MEDIIRILLKQIATMFVLMFLGAALYRGKKITDEGSRDMGAVLLYLVMPCAILNAFMTDFSMEKARALLWASAAALGSLALSMAAARIVFGGRYRIEHFGSAFSNAGFIGIPLVTAVLGSQAVFYISPFVALLNLFQWTYGVSVMTGRRDTVSRRNLCKNPILLSLLAGLLLFALPFSLPDTVAATVGMVAQMNAPLAMLVLGAYMAQADMKKLAADKLAYKTSLIRLLLIPLLTILVLSLLPDSFYDVRIAVLLAASAPIGSNVAIFAQQNRLSYTAAVKEVCLSTILSLFTMPFVLWAAMQLW